MNALLALPTEIQDLIYDFDGRYKTAMARTFTLIKQRVDTPLGKRESDRWSWDMGHIISLFDESSTSIHRPEYYAELQRRIAWHKSRMVPLEKGWGIKGITSHLKKVASSYLFKDVLGIYKVGWVYDTIFIDGVTYKSTTKVNSVALQFGGRVSNRNLNVHGTETRVGCIDVLNPEFKKSIKGRKLKVYRELGVSENGIPGKDYYFKKMIIDGKEYYRDIRTQQLRRTLKGREVGYIDINRQGNWCVKIYDTRP
jgi:hypothetical protein